MSYITNTVTTMTQFLVKGIYNALGHVGIAHMVVVIAIIACIYKGLSILFNFSANYLQIRLMMAGIKQKHVKKISIGIAILNLLITIAFLSGAYFVLGDVGRYVDLPKDEAVFISMVPKDHLSNLMCLLFPFGVFLSSAITEYLSYDERKTAGSSSKLATGLGLYSILILTMISFSCSVGMSFYWMFRTAWGVPYQKLLRKVNKKVSDSLQKKLEANPEKYQKYLDNLEKGKKAEEKRVEEEKEMEKQISELQNAMQDLKKKEIV